MLRAAKPKPKAAPFNDIEVQLAKIVLCHPELAPRVALLAPQLESPELKRFVESLVDALVRFHDVAPRDALPRVPVSPRGQLIALADRVRLDGPDRTLGLQTAMSMLEGISSDLLERSSLEARLGALQPALARADEASDNVERKRILLEQKALVASLQALDGTTPKTKPLAIAVGRVVEQLPAHDAPAEPPSFFSKPHLQNVQEAEVLPPESPSRPALAPHPTTSTPSSAPEEPPWAGDPDDDPWAV